MIPVCRVRIAVKHRWRIIPVNPGWTGRIATVTGEIKKKEGAGINIPLRCRVFSCSWVAWGTASYRNHLLAGLVQAVEALACVNKIMTLDEELLILEPVQCVPHCPGWQGGLADEILLCQLAAVFKHFIHQLCRWRQVPDSPDVVIFMGVYNKNDPS